MNLFENPHHVLILVANTLFNIDHPENEFRCSEGELATQQLTTNE